MNDTEKIGGCGACCKTKRCCLIKGHISCADCRDHDHCVIKAVFLNECKTFQHTQVVFCAIPFIQRFQPVAGIFCAFKAKGFLIFAFLDGTVLTGFSFAAIAAAMAGKSLTLVGLAQGTIHPAGCHKLLQSHFLFSISHTIFGHKKPANQWLTGLVVAGARFELTTFGL